MQANNTFRLFWSGECGSPSALLEVVYLRGASIFTGFLPRGNSESMCLLSRVYLTDNSLKGDEPNFEFPRTTK